MASLTDVAKAEGYLKACTRLTNLRVPICKATVDFQISFKSSIAAEDAASFIQTLGSTRNDMANALLANVANDVKIASVEAYLPHLYRFLDCCNSGQKIQMDKDVIFEWRGAITDRPDFFKSPDLVYEIMMVLHTKVCFG